MIAQMINQTLETADRLARRQTALARRAAVVRARVTRLQSARLFSGAAFALALVVAAVKPRWGVPVPAVLVFAPVFAWLVVLTRRWSTFLKRLERWQATLARHEQRARGRAPLTETTFENESHGHDIGLFGSFSLWTLLDETMSDDGAQVLRAWLTGPVETREVLEARSERVRAHRRDAWFYTKLSLNADREARRHSTHQILDFLARPLAAPIWKFALTWIIWILWLVSLAVHGPSAWIYAAFAVLNYSLIGRSGDVFLAGVGASEHLATITPLLAAIENRASLASEAPTITREKPSRAARRLSFAVGMLGTSANPILHLAINAFTPYTATGTWLLERARVQLGATFPESLRELARLEALFSLVLFDRYQTKTYARLDAEKLSARAVFHPLIGRDRVVANDFTFDQGHTLGLLTGSNMSGKSTFLRTIALNQTLANIGAPVFADELATHPMTIETCIEVSDSLRDGFSYFYAEVRRLKEVLDHAQRGRTLYLIDEIFRGTNNRERQIGSRAVIEALAASPQSQGFVSTHDLELARLARIQNLHFREEISQDGAMSFTYRLQQGASPTTNALRIMQLEGLPVDASAGQL